MKIKVTFDGKEYMVEEGLTVLDAALSCGINIPHLCSLPEIDTWGGCRMCLVQIEGVRGYPASCTIKVQEGMKITVLSAELAKLRTLNFQLLLSRHPANCLTCSKNQSCELQKTAADLGINERRYDKTSMSYNKYLNHPLITVDDSYCIGCQRCVRVCKEAKGSNIICMVGRGIKSHIAFYEDEDKLVEKCSGCMKCVQACPVAALKENK